MPDTLVTLSSVARFVKETSIFITAGHLNTRGWLDVELGLACLGLCRLDLGTVCSVLGPLLPAFSLPSLCSPHSGSKQEKLFVRGEPQGQGDSSVLQASGVKVPLPKTGFCCKVNKQLHKPGIFLGSVEGTLWHSCDPLGCVVLANLPEPLFPWQSR